MKKTWMPIAAGILEIVSWSVPLIFLKLLWSNSFWTSQPVLWLLWPLGTAGTYLPLVMSNVLYAVGGLSAIAAGILPFLRKFWILSLACSIGSLIWSPLLGMPAILLIIGSRDQFDRQSSSNHVNDDEHLQNTEHPLA